MTTAQLEILNEQGKNLLDVKKVLIDNQSNPLIYDTLLSSIKRKKYEKKVEKALADKKVTLDMFTSLLSTSSEFSNKDLFIKLYTDYQKRMISALEKKGYKIMSEVSVESGGLVIIKKLGVSLSTIQKQFHIMEDEAFDLLKDGFVEKFSRLMLSALTRNLIQLISKEIPLQINEGYEMSTLYFDEEKNIFNIDFRIVLSIPVSDLKMNKISIPISTVKRVSQVLDLLQKEYYRFFK